MSRSIVADRRSIGRQPAQGGTRGPVDRMPSVDYDPTPADEPSSDAERAQIQSVQIRAKDSHFKSRMMRTFGRRNLRELEVNVIAIVFS